MKNKRTFELYNKFNQKIASGVCYDELNCQILWRKDIGYTAEQYSNIGQVLFLMPNISYFIWRTQ